MFSLAAIALTVRRCYVSGETTTADRNKLIGFLILIIASSIDNAAFWAISNNGWIGYIVTISIWILSTLGLQLTPKQARRPKK